MNDSIIFRISAIMALFFVLLSCLHTGIFEDDSIPYGSEGYPDFKPPVTMERGYATHVSYICGEWKAMITCTSILPNKTKDEGYYWNDNKSVWVRDDARVLFDFKNIDLFGRTKFCVDRTTGGE